MRWSAASHAPGEAVREAGASGAGPAGGGRFVSAHAAHSAAPNMIAGALT
jgi:hypothetical protein